MGLDIAQLGNIACTLHFAVRVDWVHRRLQRFGEPVLPVWPSVKYVSIVSVKCINACLNKHKATGFVQHLPYYRSVIKVNHALGGNEVCTGKHTWPSWVRTWTLFSLGFNSRKLDSRHWKSKNTITPKDNVPLLRQNLYQKIQTFFYCSDENRFRFCKGLSGPGSY